MIMLIMAQTMQFCETTYLMKIRWHAVQFRVYVFACSIWCNQVDSYHERYNDLCQKKQFDVRRITASMLKDQEIEHIRKKWSWRVFQTSTS